MDLTTLTTLASAVTVDGTTRLNLSLINQGEVVGSCYIEGWDMAGGCICMVFVPELYRRLGIGRRLIQECLRQAHKQGKEALALMVAKDNAEAQLLYEQVGFVTAFTYSDGSKFMSYTFPHS